MWCVGRDDPRSVSHRRVLNVGDDPDSTAALVAGFNVNSKYAPQALGSSPSRMALRGRSELGDCLAASGRCHLLPPAAVEGKDAVETGEVEARAWTPRRLSGR
jgi:hypothetical protein